MMNVVRMYVDTTKKNELEEAKKLIDIYLIEQDDERKFKLLLEFSESTPQPDNIVQL